MGLMGRVTLERFLQTQSRHRAILLRLQREAQKSRQKNKHAAAVVDERGTIVGIGRNGDASRNSFFSVILRRQFGKRITTVHAEFEAILDALRGIAPKDLLAIFGGVVPRQFREKTMYCYRETLTGMFANAKPCSYICEPTLRLLGFRDTFYTLPHSSDLEHVLF
ncbi:MAG: hypothetical protein Q7K44_03285 [Candidatus Liptonbacteria bacterium]|nr:hypothetical protein [Candidatus Liptonbacteria bacterium]